MYQDKVDKGRSRNLLPCSDGCLKISIIKIWLIKKKKSQVLNFQHVNSLNSAKRGANDIKNIHEIYWQPLEKSIKTGLICYIH